MSANERRPAKAGSWYLADANRLSRQLERNLDGVDAAAIAGCDGFPIAGARAVIAPHAGYEYSGECAAWAYKCLDLSRAKRVFILGPAHVAWTPHCAVTAFGSYGTPFGPLKVDEATIAELKAAADIPDLQRTVDTREHSLELHLPYLYKRLEQTFSSPEDFPAIVPIVVGGLKPAEEKKMGRVLAPYVRDHGNAFIVSSDFCHWGDNFDYTPYSATRGVDDLVQLDEDEEPDAWASVEETIRAVDMHAMRAISGGSHDAFLASLKLTRNTVCGRHPIGVMMAALEVVAAEAAEDEKEGRYRFRQTKYTTSGRVKNDPPIVDSAGHSVSYLSAYALL